MHSSLIQRYGVILNPFFAQEVLVDETHTKLVLSDEHSKQQRLICQALQSANDMTLLEYDVKQLFGFK